MSTYLDIRVPMNDQIFRNAIYMACVMVPFHDSANNILFKGQPNDNIYNFIPLPLCANIANINDMFKNKNMGIYVYDIWCHFEQKDNNVPQTKCAKNKINITVTQYILKFQMYKLRVNYT